jgi:hypothetical protein
MRHLKSFFYPLLVYVYFRKKSLYIRQVDRLYRYCSGGGGQHAVLFSPLHIYLNGSEKNRAEPQH